MGRTKGSYQAEFPKGSEVRVASRSELETFQKEWKYHHKLLDEQLEYAGTIARVARISFYHGGDELYELEGVRGIWHECCLTAVTHS
jgi:hypothetical protein